MVQYFFFTTVFCTVKLALSTIMLKFSASSSRNE